jgi:hypothetical protein
MQKYSEVSNFILNPSVAGILRYIDINDLSMLLGRSVSTIRNQLVVQARNPDLRLLPQPFRPVGSRLLRWHPLAVADFMAEASGRLMVLGGIVQPPLTASKRKRGRPPKKSCEQSSTLGEKHV